jgi:hypothetical protein
MFSKVFFRPARGFFNRAARIGITIDPMMTDKRTSFCMIPGRLPLTLDLLAAAEL